MPQPRRSENGAAPFEVARLGACHTLQGAAANNAIPVKGRHTWSTLSRVREREMRFPSGLGGG
jgi:hypothetical protein